MQKAGLKQLPMKSFSKISILLPLVFSHCVAANDQQRPLTSLSGRAEAGELVFSDRDKGHCLLCHQFSASNAPFQGTIGPSLDGVADRLSAAQLRFRIVDQSRLNPSTVMPAYYRTDGLAQVAEAYKDKTVLTAQEIEDLVAYLNAGSGKDVRVLDD
jgi:sulfur-oxidizing protein SoxX